MASGEIQNISEARLSRESANNIFCSAITCPSLSIIPHNNAELGSADVDIKQTRPQVREELYGVPADKAKRESTAQLILDLYMKVCCQCACCVRDRLP